MDWLLDPKAEFKLLGHYGTGNLESTQRDLDDLDRAKPLLIKSYEAN